MIDRKTKNAQIFADTKKHYTTDGTLENAVRFSKANQWFVAADTVMELPPCRKNGKATVKVSGKRSLEAAEYYAKQGKEVCVLNFASATNPGGGVVHGSSAQEESICRCTTLYPCLNSHGMWDSFYGPHRNANNPLYNDDCIYTPKVCVFKSDVSFPEMLPQSEWWYTDIITCAAPNLRRKPSNEMNPNAGDTAADISESELEKLLTSRIRRIFELAAGNKVDVLILGAFGCGAFRNPPKLVAKVFHNIMEEYIGYFETIEFAVYHRPHEDANYTAFCEEMK